MPFLNVNPIQCGLGPHNGSLQADSNLGVVIHCVMTAQSATGPVIGALQFGIDGPVFYLHLI